MTKKILLTIPVALLLIWASYVTFTDWKELKFMYFIMYFFILLLGIHFIFMQLTHKFIDVIDFCKVKSINAENMQAFRKQRRAYSVIIAVVIVFAFAFKNVF